VLGSVAAPAMSANYKGTLNLPRMDFPMKANLRRAAAHQRQLHKFKENPAFPEQAFSAVAAGDTRKPFWLGTLFTAQKELLVDLNIAPDQSLRCAARSVRVAIRFDAEIVRSPRLAAVVHIDR
jgi:hypothetical protein